MEALTNLNKCIISFYWLCYNHFHGFTFLIWLTVSKIITRKKNGFRSIEFSAVVFKRDLNSGDSLIKFCVAHISVSFCYWLNSWVIVSACIAEENFLIFFIFHLEYRVSNSIGILKGDNWGKLDFHKILFIEQIQHLN